MGPCKWFIYLLLHSYKEKKKGIQNILALYFKPISNDSILSFNKESEIKKKPI